MKKSFRLLLVAALSCLPFSAVQGAEYRQHADGLQTIPTEAPVAASAANFTGGNTLIVIRDDGRHDVYGQLRHLRAGSAHLLAYPPRRPAPRHRQRHVLDADGKQYENCSSYGRYDLVPAERQALARRVAGRRNDPPGLDGSPKRQKRHLAGARIRRAILRQLKHVRPGRFLFVPICCAANNLPIVIYPASPCLLSPGLYSHHVYSIKPTQRFIDPNTRSGGKDSYYGKS